MSDDDLKLTRRYFLQQAAVSSALLGGAAGIVLKTDAAAQDPTPSAIKGNNENGRPYPYVNPP